MLDAPFPVLLADLILAICHLSVDIAAQLKQKLNHAHELVLVLKKLIIAPFLRFQLNAARLVLDLLSMFQRIYHLLHVFLVVGQCVFGEALEEVQQEVEAIVIDLLEVGLQLAHVAFL